MNHDPDDKVGDDYPGENRDEGQPFPFMTPSSQKTLKQIFGLQDTNEEGGLPNPYRQEPDNKPSQVKPHPQSGWNPTAH